MRTYEEYKSIVDEHILDFIPNIDNKSATLFDAMKYSLIAGGKRLRPVLLLAACEFADGDINEALPFAIAMEYIHTYSLIHDDLPAMDDDDLRRGQPTNHKVFGEAMAILAGDGLLTTAFDAISKDMMLYFDDHKKLTKRAKAAYEIAKGAGVRGMIAGQVSDMEAENGNCSNEMLDYIHLNKTGALIKSAIKAGLYLGTYTQDMIDSFESFAEYLGLAFQIADDILDVTQTSEILGKTANSDLESNKCTYVALNGLDSARLRLSYLSRNAIEAISQYGQTVEFFNKLVLDLEVRTA